MTEEQIRTTKCDIIEKAGKWVVEWLKKSIHQDQKIKFWSPFQVNFIAKYNPSILYFYSSALYFY